MPGHSSGSPASGRPAGFVGHHRRFLILMAIPLMVASINGGTCALMPPGSSLPAGTSQGSDGIPRPVVLASDHVLGDATAPLVVVLYEDYQDTGCGRFARSEFPTIKARYIDTGQVLWVFRHFPLASHNRAIPAAKAAECADDQGEFLAYRDLIYETTDSSGNTILTDAQLGAHADTLGLNRATLEACFAGEAKTARVQQDVKSGTALGVTVAPSFIVGNKLVSGFTLAEDLSTTIDRQLAGP